MKISVIIPTRNEEINIALAIHYLRTTSDRNTTEIIVVDGQSSDRTIDIAQGLADKVIRAVCLGRAAQMHEGALSANGDLLLFLHADTQLPANWQERLNEVWAPDNKTIATAFRLGFDSERPFFRFLASVANWRTSWTCVPHGDQSISIQKDIYFRVGGFPPVPIMEEYFLFKKLRRLGCVRLLPEAIKTSVRRYEQNGRVFNGLRNVLIIALFYLGVPPRHLARMYW
ncbi:MAG: TIGR04283 family arsenosugar biosynthesis glycosyltransferase [Elusimicrobia bacterium]|nr:TIGR04283 family arsenosugar biosynthesis glycosyltransferase [Elusimicrobiota bacterium]